MSLGILDLSLGAIEVAVLMASLLFGMSLVQTYIYAITCSGDRTWLKTIVAAVCVFETLHTVSVWAYLYHLTVAQFGNPLALFELPWYFCVSITLQAVAGGLVQAFYVWRVYIVSQKWWLATPPALGALVRTVIAIVITVLSMRVGNLPVFREQYSYTVFIAVISSAVADLWNTAALCWFLCSRSTVHTRGAVNRVIIWAIETGLVTSVAAMCLIVFWVTMPGNGLWVAALLVYAKLYSNSLLVSLNARSSVKASLASSGQHASRSLPSASPIVITRTRNYEVSGAQESLPGKSEYDSDALAMPMSDFSRKRRDEHPFASC